MDNYNIVLFKNNNKKKLIKKYRKLKTAKNKFKQLLNKNKEIIFYQEFVNAEECKHYLAIVTNQEKIQKTLFLVDEIGRNIPVNIDHPDFVFLEIKPFKIEEKIFDWEEQKKISLENLLKKYCSSNELKSIFTLNNKLCIQINENINLFSLKNKDDADRLLNILENMFIDGGRVDAIFIRDVSSPQRKWVYKTLEEKGYDKKRLYRLKTTFSKR